MSARSPCRGMWAVKLALNLAEPNMTTAVGSSTTWCGVLSNGGNVHGRSGRRSLGVAVRPYRSNCVCVIRIPSDDLQLGPRQFLEQRLGSTGFSRIGKMSVLALGQRR
jgi:hypothetical protein